MAKKRISIKDKKIPQTSDIDTLFPTGSVTPEDSKPDKKVPALKKMEDIISYYKDYKGGKQVSIYLPEEIHRKVKSKAVQEGSNMKDAIKAVVLDNYLTESEIKEAYNEYIDELKNT
ncbi:hypothetical protein JZO86_14420 [Enterococcus ureasiticus]|uniref:plasmid partition protein ParG n=1 Tax=Enterococcus ureasiticus TaxID=903984 RepID=UPI001A8C1519|nr:plasmid partition protein ParG [Enterococcus ureasiticus]MBO0474894.1 hypothetical protein [Enterococcus ureasiticus]